MGVVKRNLYLDRGDMVATRIERVQLAAILLRYVSKKRAHDILKDMDEEVADTTENYSLRETIKRVRKYLEDHWLVDE